MYTPHPPIIRAYCSLRALLSFRGVFACLRNSRAVFLKKLLTPLFSSGHRQLETEPSDKLSEVSGAPLNVATNTPLAFHENARSVLVANGLGRKVVINFRELAALPNRLSPFPDGGSVEGGNFLLVSADCLDGVLLVHSNTHFPPLLRVLIVCVDCLEVKYGAISARPDRAVSNWRISLITVAGYGDIV